MSLLLLKPGFTIPNLLELQGFQLQGEDKLFWTRVISADNIARTANEDVAALLSSVHPTLVALNLAGYDVDHVLLSTYGDAPSTLLDIDLTTLCYDILHDGLSADGHTYWYTRTGMDWPTEPSLRLRAEDAKIPWDTLAAIAFIVRERPQQQTGYTTYAIPLDGLVVTVPNTADPTLKAIVVTTSTDDPDNIGQYAMEDMLSALQPYLGELIYWVEDALNSRWLKDESQPVGLLHNFNPDEGLTRLASGKPTRWGSPIKLSAADEIILEACREVWQYLQTLDFDTFYIQVTQMPAVDFLDAVWDDLRARNLLPHPFISSRHRTRRFARTVHLKFQQFADLDLPDDFMQSLSRLPWAELLMLLHNMYVIDMLSGVSVDEDTAIILSFPDVTGFYETANGLITVQLNQADSYVWGFMQERKQVDVSGYSGYFHVIEYYEFDGDSFFYSAGDYGTIPDPFSITSQTISINADGLLVLDWHLSNGKHYVLTRNVEAPVVPDETLNGLPKNADGTLPDSVKVVVLSQRAPLSAGDESALYGAVGIFKEYLSAYLTSSTISETAMLQWLIALEVAMRPFAVIDTPDGEVNDDFPLVFIENDQFPLVHYRLCEILQSTALDDSPTSTKTIYQGLLELFFWRGADGLQPLDQYIMYITGISLDEAIALGGGSEDGAILTSGAYVYEFRMTSVSVTGGFIIGGSVSPTVVDVRRLSDDSASATVLWTSHYYGNFKAVGLGIGLSMDFAKSIKSLLQAASGSKGTWTKLYANIEWEPSDFSGLVTVTYRQANIGWVASYQITIFSRTTFWEISKGRAPGYGYLSSETLNDTWAKMKASASWGPGWGASYVAFTGNAQIFPIPFTGSINDRGVVEPLAQSASYTSTLPAVTSGVHFAVDGYTLNADGQFILKRLAAKFRIYLTSIDTILEIHGYASPSGSDQYNLDLSDKRAQSVYDYLYAVLGDEFSVPTQRTIVLGHGEYDAVYIDKVPNGTEVAKWRRVDVVINGALICSVFGEKGTP